MFRSTGVVTEAVWVLTLAISKLQTKRGRGTNRLGGFSQGGGAGRRKRRRGGRKEGRKEGRTATTKGQDPGLDRWATGTDEWEGEGGEREKKGK